MDPLLPGRWQAYKFTIKGTPTFCDKGKGLLFQIHPDGKVDYAYYYKGAWYKDGPKRTVKEENGETIITEDDGRAEKPLYLVQELTENEVQFAVIERYTKPLLVYYLRKLPNK